MVTDEVDAGRRDEGSEASEEGARGEEELASAIGEGAFHAVAEAAVVEAVEAVEGEGRAEAVAAEALSSAARPG